MPPAFLSRYNSCLISHLVSIMELHSLLSLLADGQYHSGSDLGVRLGVSRTAVWKVINNLSDIHIDVLSVKGKGYCIEGGLDLLSADGIYEFLPLALKKLCDLHLLLAVDSTNTWVMDNRKVSKPYTFCLAELQKEGKGRRGRQWVSPFGKNICLSVGFDLPGGVEVLSGLSLVIGISVIRALNMLGVSSAKLKWPNDILIDGQKVAGILVELQGEATTGWRVTAGIGLNVAMNRSEGEGIDQPWVSLSKYVDFSRDFIASALIESVVNVLEVYRREGFSVFVEEWQSSDLLRGKYVQISASEIAGIALGVDASGALLLDTENGVKSVNAGEVSIQKNDT